MRLTIFATVAIMATAPAYAKHDTIHMGPWDEVSASPTSTAPPANAVAPGLSALAVHDLENPPRGFIALPPALVNKLSAMVSAINTQRGLAKHK